MNMQDEILRIWKETGMTAIMVTHDVDEAVYLSDKVVVMTPRPGRITGTLDIKLARPSTQLGGFSSLPCGDPSSAPLRRHNQKSPTTIFKIALKNVRSLLLFLLYIFLERTENHEKRTVFYFEWQADFSQLHVTLSLTACGGSSSNSDASRQ